MPAPPHQPRPSARSAPAPLLSQQQRRDWPQSPLLLMLALVLRLPMPSMMMVVMLLLLLIPLLPSATAVWSVLVGAWSAHRWPRPSPALQPRQRARATPGALPVARACCSADRRPTEQPARHTARRHAEGAGRAQVGECECVSEQHRALAMHPPASPAIHPRDQPVLHPPPLIHPHHLHPAPHVPLLAVARWRKGRSCARRGSGPVQTDRTVASALMAPVASSSHSIIATVTASTRTSSSCLSPAPPPSPASSPRIADAQVARSPPRTPIVTRLTAASASAA